MKKRINRALLYLQRIMPRSEKVDPVASLRICWYLQERMEFDVAWDAYNPAPELPKKIDELWFVASSWAFLEDKFRQRTLEIFPLADKVIWLNNDFNVPWHGYHLGRCRPDARLIALSTVEKTQQRFNSGDTFNWNRLTYDPIVSMPEWEDRLDRFYYYGSVRPGRMRTFDRYFPWLGNRLTLSAANGKAVKEFAARYPTIEVTGRCEDVFAELSRYRVTLLLEDKHSFNNFVSPPNRFYEALSAGTAMYFEEEAVPMWKQYGYDVRPFVIKSDEHPDAMLDAARSVARKQKKWAGEFMTDLDADFVRVRKRIDSDQVGITGPPEGAKRYL